MKEKSRYILGIETSTLRFSLALTDGERPLAEYSAEAGRNLDGLLLPAAEELLGREGLEPEDLHGVAVSRGPGYFTGIRIGIAAAKGIAFALGKPAAGVVSLDSICENTAPVFDCLICSVMSAGRGEVYARLYRLDAGTDTRVPVTPCLLERPEALLQRVGEKTIFLCRDTGLAGQIKRSLADRAIIMPPAFGIPRAVNTARLGAKKLGRAAGDLRDLEPVYLRKPDAEINFLAGSIAITPATEDDLPEITRIEGESFPCPWTEGMFLRELEKESGLFVTAKVRDRVCGYAAGWAAGGEFHLANIAVAPEFRGMGCGKKLLKYVIDSVKSMNARYIILEVRQGNTAAFNLYRKFGFKAIGKREKYYPDTSENAIIMALMAGNK